MKVRAIGASHEVVAVSGSKSGITVNLAEKSSMERMFQAAVLGRCSDLRSRACCIRSFCESDIRRFCAGNW